MKLPARKCYIDVGLSLTFIEMFSIQEKGISKAYRTGLGKYQRYIKEHRNPRSSHAQCIH